MRGKNHNCPLISSVPQQINNDLPVMRIERSGGFICENYRRVLVYSARNSKTLFFSSTEMRRGFLSSFCQSSSSESLSYLFAVPSRTLSKWSKLHGDIESHAFLVHNAVVLKDERGRVMPESSTSSGCRVRDIFAIDHKSSTIRFL